MAEHSSLERSFSDLLRRDRARRTYGHRTRPVCAGPGLVAGANIYSFQRDCPRALATSHRTSSSSGGFSMTGTDLLTAR